MLRLLKGVICGGVSVYVKCGSMRVLYINYINLLEIMRVVSLSGIFRMNGLLDIICVDKKGRFELTYVLVSYLYGERVNFRVFLGYSSAISSLIFIFKSSSWLEREVWDMFGLFISGHGDLRRILTDYGFYGNPLRKSFPLVGYYEVRYDEVEKRVVVEGVSVMQEFRIFEFVRAWS